MCYISNMKYLLTLLLSAALTTHAQSAKTRHDDYSKIEFGLGIGPAHFDYSDDLLWGNNYSFVSTSLNGNINWRLTKHFQMGVAVNANVSGDAVTVLTYNMSFPVGNDKIYFYPGWHIRYFMPPEGKSNGGPGPHMGLWVKLADMVAVTGEAGLTPVFWGGEYYYQFGLRLLVPNGKLEGNGTYEYP